MNKYVIIGNGTAAVGCIEGIRSVDKDSGITVVSAENHHVYCRPLISYYLENKTTVEKMKYRPDDFYSVNNCKVIYGKKAEKIDKENKKVVIDGGETLDYTAVCIATGSSPFVPPFKGLESVEKKFSFMTLDDALSLEEAITPESRVLIIGAGLIGLKCAEGIAERVKSITVCDLAERVLSSILDDECAALMQKKLEAHGIGFMLGDSAESFDKNTAVMKSGKKVEFDILVLAVGVRANTSLAKDAGAEVNRGIVTDLHMKTAADSIYAAGDCSESYDISCGMNRVLAILPNAYMQGFCAGQNMAGKESVFDKSIPMNSIGFFGLHAMTAGSYFTEKDGGEMYEEKSDGKIKRLYTKDGVLTGFIIIGDTARVGIYTSLIREKTPIDSIDFEMIKKYPSLLPFGADYRRQKLGGVV